MGYCFGILARAVGGVRRGTLPRASRWLTDDLPPEPAMTDKHRTQAMPDDGLKGAPDGTNRPSEARDAPRPRSERDKRFKGGQSQMAYHGAHQLGTRARRRRRQSQRTGVPGLR